MLPPSQRDRDTCRCRVHNNLQFVVDKLHSLSLLHCTSIERLCESISCDIHNKNWKLSAAMQDPVVVRGLKGDEALRNTVLSVLYDDVAQYTL